jgi:hypothetical protein
MRNKVIAATAALALFIGAAAVLISSTANADTCRMEPSANGKGWTWVCR